MEDGIQQHGGMAHRKNESITIGPTRITGVITQKPVPQAIGHRCQSHGGAGMTGVRGLYRVHRQRPNGVDTELLYGLLP